jgi:cytidyltransferase-like protein
VSGKRGRGGPGGVSTVVVTASLDNMTSADVRLLQEAARLGPVHVRVPSDELVERMTGEPPTFPQAERRFLAAALRCVNTVGVVDRDIQASLPSIAGQFRTLVIREGEDAERIRAAWTGLGRELRTVGASDLEGFPDWFTDSAEARPGRADPRRTVVTGCYDWLHSGHIRFFMDAARFGSLYVVVGSDRNVELLKGPGHPLQREQERRYTVGAVRHVHRAVLSTGSGWMDAEPEIAWIRPTSYVVNEDGDQPEKREFCASRGIEYVVLRRLPHRGLPARTSTNLRGF